MDESCCNFIGSPYAAKLKAVFLATFVDFEIDGEGKNAGGRENVEVGLTPYSVLMSYSSFIARIMFLVITNSINVKVAHDLFRLAS